LFFKEDKRIFKNLIRLLKNSPGYSKLTQVNSSRNIMGLMVIILSAVSMFSIYFRLNESHILSSLARDFYRPGMMMLGILLILLWLKNKDLSVLCLFIGILIVVSTINSYISISKFLPMDDFQARITAIKNLYRLRLILDALTYILVLMLSYVYMAKERKMIFNVLMIVFLLLVLQFIPKTIFLEVITTTPNYAGIFSFALIGLVMHRIVVHKAKHSRFDFLD